MTDMAQVPQPDYDHDPSAPWPSIDWIVVVPTTVLVVIAILALLAGIITIGGPS